MKNLVWGIICWVAGTIILVSNLDISLSAFLLGMALAFLLSIDGDK